jgi:hypothetical protein
METEDAAVFSNSPVQDVKRDKAIQEFGFEEGIKQLASNNRRQE